MNEIQANKIDEILYLLTNQNSGTNYPKMFVDGISIQLGWTKDEINDLFDIIEQIKYSNSQIATIVVQDIPKIKTARYINATYNTEQFLKAGGCIKYYYNLLEDQKNGNRLKEMGEQKLKNDLASFKITKNQYRWTKGIAIAGLIIALVSFLLQFFHK